MDRRMMLVLIPVAAMLILLLGTWAINIIAYRPRERSRRATATARAAAWATALRRTVEAQDATTTAQAQALEQERAVHATIQALAARVTAIAQATAAQSTVQALNATATAQAQEQRCWDIRSYTLAVAPRPALSIPPGTIYVVGDPPPAVYAVWVVTNTGGCPWEGVELQPLAGGRAVTPLLRRDGEWVKRVEPGERVKVVLEFPVQAAGNMDEEWVVKVGDFSLFDQPHLRLRVRGWVISVTPMPTPAPMPTPHCYRVCDTCTRTITDPITGAQTTETYECNCRTVCE